MADIFDTIFGTIFGTVFQYEIIVSSGQYLGNVVCYTQSVVSFRQTVRAN